MAGAGNATLLQRPTGLASCPAGMHAPCYPHRHAGLVPLPLPPPSLPPGPETDPPQSDYLAASPGPQPQQPQLPKAPG